MSQSRTGVLFLLVSLALAPACSESSPDGTGMTNQAPDLTDQHKGGDKADAVAAVYRVYDATSADPWPGKAIVKVSTFGISAVSVGIVYQIQYAGNYWSDMSDGQWHTAYGYYSGKEDNGASLFTVEVELDYSLGTSGYMRYAVFAIDGDSDQTHWDNNGGGDYFMFSNPSGSPMLSVTMEPGEDTAVLDLYTLDFGMETLNVTYTVDGWGTTKSADAEWLEQYGNTDHWRLVVATPEGTAELSLYGELTFSDARIRADNFGHDYHFGFTDAAPAIITFTEDGIDIDGTLKKGGFFQVFYDRKAKCTNCKYGMCSRSITMQYRLYQDHPFWEEPMYQRVNYDYETNTEVLEPPVMHTETVYIPLNADHLSIWFYHSGGYPPCSEWDSNNGEDYGFDL